MTTAVLRDTLLRFVCGAAGSILLGLVAFRGQIWDATNPQFQVVTVGVVMAAIMALLRARATSLAALTVAVFAGSQFGISLNHGVRGATALLLWCLIISGGIVLTSIIYELLDARGLRFGKFVLVGPLLGGVYFAATPATLIALPGSPGAIRTLLLNVFLGIVIGDGVGFGIEMVDLARRRPAAPASPADVPRTAGNGA